MSLGGSSMTKSTRPPASTSLSAATAMAAPMCTGGPADQAPARLVETHSAILVFVGDLVAKMKKPVDLGFLDFRNRDARLDACREEVALNRRLAPDVYLGVADVIGPDGTLADHLVMMRRLPDSARLSTLVSGDAPLADEIGRLAHQLAAFHSRCGIPTDALAIAGPDGLRDLWLSSLDPMRVYAPDVLDPDLLEQVRTDALTYLAGRHDLLRQRVRDGRIREGHGDLLAEDIFCLPDGPRILDCLEFDRRLRACDVLADRAFLAMDLERLGAPELARKLMSEYAELAGDSPPDSLQEHYIAYRAVVRAKVACVRVGQGDAAAAGEARGLLDLAARHLDRGRVRLVAVGGLPGTGKSTLAQRIGHELGAAVLSSDILRKEIAGLSRDDDAASPIGGGIYRASTTHLLYAELIRRAAALLRQGVSVVIDASWSDPEWRASLGDLGDSCVAELTALQCTTPAPVARERLAGRQRPAHGSDATVDVHAHMARSWVDWPEAHQIDTTMSARRSIRAARESILGRAATLV